MFDFNAYVRSFFRGGRVEAGMSQAQKENALKGVLETLNRQLSLLDKGRTRNLHATFSQKGENGEVVLNPGALCDREGKLLTGAAFDAALDRLTGEVLTRQMAQNLHGKDECRKIRYHSNYTAGFSPVARGILQNSAKSEIAQNWAGFKGCTEQVRPDDDAAIRLAADAVSKGDRLGGFAHLAGNMLAGGNAGTGPFDPSIFDGFMNQLNSAKGSFHERILSALEWAKKVLAEEPIAPPPPSDDGDGRGECPVNGEPSDAEGEGEPSEEGQGQGQGDQEGDPSEDGKGEDGEGTGEGEPKPKEGKGEGKKAEETLKEWAEKSRGEKGEPKPADKEKDPFGSTGTGSGKYADEAKLDSLSEGKTNNEYKITEKAKAAASRITKATSTKWQTLAENCGGNPAGANAAFRTWAIQNRKAIRTVADSIHFPARDSAMSEYGCRSGDLDEHALWTVGAGISSGRLFERREVISRPRKLIALLLDMSGSMAQGTSVPGHTRIGDATHVVSLIVEAWKLLRLEGAELAVYGHTAELSSPRTLRGKDWSLDMVRIADRTGTYSDWLAQPEKFSMVQNYDGLAIDEAYRELGRVYPEISPSDTTLIVISDGTPAGYGYGYDDASTGIAHVAHIVEKHRRNGANTFAIGVANAYTPEVGEAMYGKGNNVVLTDVAGCLPIITKMMKRICDR